MCVVVVVGADPDTVKTLTGVMCKSVSCGMGHTTFLLDKDAETKDLKSYNPPEDKPPAAAGKGGKRPASGMGEGGGGRGAGARVGGGPGGDVCVCVCVRTWRAESACVFASVEASVDSNTSFIRYPYFALSARPFPVSPASLAPFVCCLYMLSLRAGGKGGAAEKKPKKKK